MIIKTFFWLVKTSWGMDSVGPGVCLSWGPGDKCPFFPCYIQSRRLPLLSGPERATGVLPHSLSAFRAVFGRTDLYKPCYTDPVRSTSPVRCCHTQFWTTRNTTSALPVDSVGPILIWLRSRACSCRPLFGRRQLFSKLSTFPL